jgi:DNA-binding NarL/FixJ family response regulator
MSPLKVLIVDDHALFREGLHYILDNCEDITVIGEASDGIEALEKVRTLRPDIVLLDITMPKLNGIDTLMEIKSFSHKTKAIVLTMHAKEQFVHESLVSGADGYVLKESASEDLMAAIRSVAKGDLYLSPLIAKRLITHAIKSGERTALEDSKYEGLTKREKEILHMVSQELTTRQIAEVLRVSVRTVESHRNNMMKKLDIHTKTGLIKYAIQTGLIEI